MAGEARQPGLVDEVQTFRSQAAEGAGQVALAISPNSEITTLRVEPRGAMPILAKDSDEILVVVAGACTVEEPSGTHELHAGQGFLLPLGVACRITNNTDEAVTLLSMLTKRSTPYVTNVASAVTVRMPAAFLDGLGLGSRLYAYVIDCRTIGISPLIMEEWNQASLLRMNCSFQREGDQVVATLPERVVRWYGLDDLTDADYTLTHDRRRSRVRVDLNPLIARKARR